MDGGQWTAGTRRLDYDTARFLLLLVGILSTIVGVAGSVARSFDFPVAHPQFVFPVGLFWLVLGPATIAASFLPWSTLQRLVPAIIYVLFFSSGVTIDFTVWAAGPDRLGYVVVAVLIIPTMIARYVLHPALSWTYFALTTSGLAAVFLLQDGWVTPPVIWIVFVTYIAAAAILVGGIVERHDRARAEVAKLNATLQQRVNEQVEELGKLGQLRRFLSPQVADALSDERSEAILQPHRREIAVFFSDLRHYTRFTVAEAPEDVLISLDEYYDVVCRVLQRNQATIGSFSGDGVMAFLNDPLPHDDPASGAVRIALQMHDEMDPLVERWRDRGFELGYGVGIAMGYATLGLLGNEERSDYTAIGPVVNLASRLCAEAKNGQILVDHRTHSAVKAWATTEALEPVTLKGFPEAIPTYSVVSTASG